MTGEAEFNEVFFDGACNRRRLHRRCARRRLEGGDGAAGLRAGPVHLGQQMHFSHELELLVDAARACRADQDLSIRRRIADAWIGLRTLRANALRIFARRGGGGAGGAGW